MKDSFIGAVVFIFSGILNSWRSLAVNLSMWAGALKTPCRIYLAVVVLPRVPMSGRREVIEGVELVWRNFLSFAVSIASSIVHLS